MKTIENNIANYTDAEIPFKEYLDGRGCANSSARDLKEPTYYGFGILTEKETYKIIIDPLIEPRKSIDGLVKTYNVFTGRIVTFKHEKEKHYLLESKILIPEWFILKDNTHILPVKLEHVKKLNYDLDELVNSEKAMCTKEMTFAEYQTYIKAESRKETREFILGGLVSAAIIGGSIVGMNSHYDSDMSILMSSGILALSFTGLILGGTGLIISAGLVEDKIYKRKHINLKDKNKIKDEFRIKINDTEPVTAQ